MDFSICVNTVGFPKYSHIYYRLNSNNVAIYVYSYVCIMFNVRSYSYVWMHECMLATYI